MTLRQYALTSYKRVAAMPAQTRLIERDDSHALLVVVGQRTSWLERHIDLPLPRKWQLMLR